MTNYSPELSNTSEDIRQLTEEVYPEVNLSDPTEVDAYDAMLKQAQSANEEALAPVIEAHNSEIKRIQVKKLGDESAKVAIEQARLEQQEAAAQVINDSVHSAYDKYQR
jgi:hypothetical protein